LVSPVKMWIAGSVPWLPDGVAAACGRCQVAACVCLCVCVCVPRLCEVWHVVRLWVSAPRPRLLDGLTSPGNRAAVPCPVGEDKAVSTVAEELKPRMARGAALVHCAGALSLEVLGAPRGRVLGSFHPLVAVSDPRDSLAGNSVAVSTRSRWLREVLEQMAKDAGLRALRVPEKHRAAYHAGAVLSAGGVVAALSAAVEAFRVAGISEEDALAALLPLTRSALRGVEARGLAAGYTGPIARGDSGVVAAHLAALPPEAAEVYQPLSRRGLQLVGHRLTPEGRAALGKLLG